MEEARERYIAAPNGPDGSHPYTEMHDYEHWFYVLESVKAGVDPTIAVLERT